MKVCPSSWLFIYIMFENLRLTQWVLFLFTPFIYLLYSYFRNSTWTDADKVRSLLYLVSNDIGQISTLYAMLHNIKRIYFGGFFLRHHPVGLHTISYAVNYWSKGQVSAYFLRHEGYLGAIGAFIKGAGSAYQTDL